MKIKKNLHDVNLSTLLDIYLYDRVLDNIEDFYTYSTKTINDEILYIIIKKLTEPERRIIILYAETHNYTEIARLLNCSSNAVKKYIIKIQNKIKEELKCY